ncbi:MAG: HflK protein [Candidatus Lambdaproteobacteria bacterium RIFOXYD1_FULL_56_27]|uniref:Protein HflK n=1 Tax=Candidatus Lambdaproteobacteria bacterium RIFOXYD2_FULL_56_26 TaxID=1817773 RepID=A0A1F6GQ13_9PROT|nr:MAG: HflK protein [Candidatus Lambdaproteobacteria bacterium RIFOXYD2_FULL_56_26]OGH03730.1 MAG: HflK protein [Candidatus Lambdaproteobacteria bacterium RIFOXYC1_FULL_56_13]OGH07314.1 MAG: HflK protein [Candidatus Lambdaproteobacteria bacterium RIFOXYD1_FULL_56_27]
MSDPGNPWGNRGGKKPADLDEMILKGLKKLFGSQKPSPVGPSNPKENQTKNVGTLVILGLAAILAYLSVYQIQPGEQGVLLRFGQFHSTASPGLNFLIPLVEKVIKVDVETIRKEQFGIQSAAGFGETTSSSSEGALESLMLTSDLNVIQTSWVAQFKIRDPEMFLFNIENPRAAVRDISESVLRRMVGNRDFNYVLNNREELAISTQKEMQDLLDKYNSGIQIVTVQLLDLNPPDPVRPSFNEVNEAEQDKIRSGNEAQQEANRRIPKAEGTARKTIEEAEGYAIEKINNAQGDVSRFAAIYKEYRNAKDVTRTRLYLEALQEALPKVQEVIVLDQSSKGMVPLINIAASTAIRTAPPVPAPQPISSASNPVPANEGAK